MLTNRTQARWAGWMALASAGLFATRGLILGCAYNRVLRHNGDQHLLCVASTGSGKTSSFVLPNLLYGWDESVVAYDPKGTLHGLSAAHRSLWTRVVYLNPLSRASDCQNPLAAIRIRTDYEVRDAQIIGEALADPTGKGADHMSGGEAHFMEMAAEGLGGLALYGLYTQQATSLPALNALTVEERWPKLLQAMARYPHKAIRRAGRVLEQIKGEGETSSIFSTLTRTLRIYTDPLLARMTSRSDFAWSDVCERARPMTLYISVPFSDQERLRPWLRLVIRQILDHVTGRGLVEEENVPQPWRWRLLGLFDEFTSLKKIQMLTQALNYTREYGFRLALITPTLQDVHEIYGNHHNIYESTEVKLAFGIRDTSIAERVSGWIGERTRWHGTGPHRQPRREPLFSATAVTNMPPRQMVIVAGNTRALATQTYYKTLTF